MAQWVRSLDLTTYTSLSPIRRSFAPSFVKYKKGCTRLAAASDKVYQLLSQGRWFSPGTPASSNTKIDRHDIAEILLKVALKYQKPNQINQSSIHFQQYNSYTMEVSDLWQQKCRKYRIHFIISRYTSTPCHGHKSSAQNLRFLPTALKLDKWNQIHTFEYMALVSLY